MKNKRMSSSQRGLSVLAFILTAGWALRFLFSFQGDHGLILKKHEFFALITGEVNYPGVYSFDKEPVLTELIARAGGFKEGLIKRDGETPPHLTQGITIHIDSNKGFVQVSDGSLPAPFKVTLKIPISLNTASREELEAIPHIGPFLARRIIRYRSLHGPFSSTETIKSMPGIGASRYSKIKPYIGI